MSENTSETICSHVKRVEWITNLAVEETVEDGNHQALKDIKCEKN